MYYPLHVHTAKGSIGDSILKIKDYISKAKTMNLTHLAITNHGSLADMYEFYYECKKENITPIIGCEVYVTDNQSERIRDYSHLVLIAKNDIGLKNLLYIVSDAQLNGMYYKPRTDLNIIKKHSEGIIALSACVAGEIPKAILNFKNADNDKKQETYNLILNKINDYKNVFKDNFYLEIQPANFTEQIYVNNLLVNLSNDLNIPLVVTNDIHYLNQEDAFIHNAHICIERKQDLTEELLYKDDVYYLMDEKDITNRLKYISSNALKQAIKNTELIAKSCNINLEIDKLDMPSIPIPTRYNEDEYLSHITINALNKCIYEFPNPLEYMERALYELNVLKVLGFSGYFLTMKDIIDHAKNNDIPVGPGRGSVCGSLVAYLIGISSVNPIKYGLMFERFLSEQRVGTVPD